MLIARDGGPAALEPAIRRPGPGEAAWVDLVRASEAELDELKRVFGFHPLALDDVRSYDQRPKLEEFGDHLFLVVHRLELGEQPVSLSSQELHAFLAGDYLVTAHAGECREIEAVLSRVQNDAEVRNRGPAFWFYLLCEAIADASGAEIDKLGGALESLEESVLTGKGERILERLLELKRQLATARRLVS